MPRQCVALHIPPTATSGSDLQCPLPPPLAGNVVRFRIPIEMIRQALLRKQRQTATVSYTPNVARTAVRFTIPLHRIEMPLGPTRVRRPDVVLLDLGLPGMSGIEGIPRIRMKWPETAVVVLTVYEHNNRVFEALCAGATGYLLKNTTPGKLVEGIHEAVRGGSPMSPGIARQVVDLFRQYRPPERSNCDLTQHEVRLLKLLVDGHSYKTAAVSLSVTVNTVAFHIKSIYGKLQVHSKSEAVARALRDNLLG
jgi:DNA-binding NarL/FixJ family response regulator